MELAIRLLHVIPSTCAIAFIALTAPCFAQLSPEIGYMLPAGGQAGTTIDVVLGVRLDTGYAGLRA